MPLNPISGEISKGPAFAPVMFETGLTEPHSTLLYTTMSANEAASGTRTGSIARSSPAAVSRYRRTSNRKAMMRSEEHTSELQSHVNLVCRLLLEKKKAHLDNC